MQEKFFFQCSKNFLISLTVYDANGKLLDLVYSNMTNVKVTASDQPLVSEDPHHKSIIIELSLSDEFNFKSKSSYCKYKFHLANYDNINRGIYFINLTRMNQFLYFMKNFNKLYLIMFL